MKDKFIATQVFLIRFVFGLIFNFRLLGVLALIFIAFCSLFSLWGAELDNELLILCGLIFLASIASELKSWNLWGFSGENKDLGALPDSGGISAGAQRNPNAGQVEETTQIQLMDDTKGNFLALAFEIERLLRVMATVTLARDIPANSNPRKLVDQLHSVGAITELGVQQIEAIRWLRNILVHGRDSEINQKTLADGIRLAFGFYIEIFNWLNNSQVNNNE